ncbi:hypothetical protein MTHERMMSTA1_08660 [Methanosarcina thermophila MST-A1]|uniref:Acetylglutamate kinase n=1 Tax=Methanosarcina thermophila TaxID=2210 RepID=A0A3G9CVV0_METTE|nr:acetylglutamate kinase [Methanosarcina thermophila]GLI13740.1 hypothetical protein MTHERMMSTA1_08660 [Methanosarcina thermophila MST-A1]
MQQHAALFASLKRANLEEKYQFIDGTIIFRSLRLTANKLDNISLGFLGILCSLQCVILDL